MESSLPEEQASKVTEKAAYKADFQELETLEKVVGANPLKLWDTYRLQALTWRSLALLLIPGTLLASALTLSTFYLLETRIEVPATPEPGFYYIENIPDKTFVQTALRLTNLITTYQPDTALPQFLDARNMLWQPALQRFQRDIIGKDFAVIQKTKRSQIFYVNTKNIVLTRHDDFVEVMIPGKRKKLLNDEMPDYQEIAWFIKMSTVAPNSFNQFGIVVYSLELKNKKPDGVKDTTKGKVFIKK